MGFKVKVEGLRVTTQEYDWGRVKGEPETNYVSLEFTFPYCNTHSEAISSLQSALSKLVEDEEQGKVMREPPYDSYA